MHGEPRQMSGALLVKRHNPPIKWTGQRLAHSGRGRNLVFVSQRLHGVEDLCHGQGRCVLPFRMEFESLGLALVILPGQEIHQRVRVQQHHFAAPASRIGDRH